jgi:hypothetical protein
MGAQAGTCLRDGEAASRASLLRVHCSLESLAIPEHKILEAARRDPRAELREIARSAVSVICG